MLAMLDHTHYRSPIDLGVWNPELEAIPSAIENARKAYATFVRFAERVKLVLGNAYADLPVATVVPPEAPSRYSKYQSYYTRFREFMDDDFNTGGVTGVLFELVTDLNKLVDTHRLEDPSTSNPVAKSEFAAGAALVRQIAQIMGLEFTIPPASGAGDTGALTTGLIQLIVEVRATLRAEAKKIAAKDDPAKKMLFDQSTAIREQLAKLGVTLEDRPGGTTWRVG